MFPQKKLANFSVPHSRANFIGDTWLSVGARPEDFTLEEIKRSAPSLIISLEEKEPWYLGKIESNIIHIPTATGKPPRKDLAEKAVTEAINALEKGGHVFVHCTGGHGRAGTLAALIYGKWKKVDAAKAIEVVSKSKESRQDTSRNFIPSPETNAQVRFLEKELGGVGPDRSDMSWLRRSKK